MDTIESKMPNMEEVRIAGISHYARVMSKTCLSGARNDFIKYADRIAHETMISLDSDAATVDRLCSELQDIARTFEFMEMQIRDLRDDIQDARTCYRDPTLSNDGFHALPAWARDMIVNESRTGSGVSHQK